MSFEQVWAELELTTPPGTTGRVIRRVMPDARCDLFLGLEKPSNLRMLLMPVAEVSIDAVHELPTSRGVMARIARPGDHGADASVELVLVDPRAADIFTALAVDLANAAADADDEASAVTALVDRLHRWQRFLEESGPAGLEPERQRGLFAEVWLIRHVLLGVFGSAVSVDAWTGPSRASHDFQFGPGAIEVKATASKQDQRLRIASERQLDATGVEALFVFHLSLDAHRESGVSLPALIDDVRGQLGTEGLAFEDRLFDAGYLDAHRHLYENPGYTVRESNFFRVTGAFPRIVESDLRPGVGDVRYSVAVAACRPFAATTEETLKNLVVS